MKNRKVVSSADSSQAETGELYGMDSGYAPYGYDGAVGCPGPYHGYDPRISIFPFFPIVPFPAFPPFFGFPPPFFPYRRRRFYW